MNNELITSEANFNKNYDKILEELNLVYKGVFDEDEAQSIAALCLIAQMGLIKILSASEQKAKGLKRDIDFAKAESYAKLKDKKIDGKKLSEASLVQFVNQDAEVDRLYREQNVAEKEARELNNLLNILKDAHLTFRALIKKGT